MPHDNQTIEINLSRTNATAAELVAKVWNLSIEEVISLCLKGSTNPKSAQ